MTSTGGADLVTLPGWAAGHRGDRGVRTSTHMQGHGFDLRWLGSPEQLLSFGVDAVKFRS